MRLKSHIWVKAYLRRRAAHGCFAAVVKHGDDDAGAIYVKINRLNGTLALYGPAPGGLGADDTGEQYWMLLHPTDVITEEQAESMLTQAIRFDSDLWIVEVEDRGGAHGFTPTEIRST
jgi:hypothetical protein